MRVSIYNILRFSTKFVGGLGVVDFIIYSSVFFIYIFMLYVEQWRNIKLIPKSFDSKMSYKRTLAFFSKAGSATRRELYFFPSLLMTPFLKCILNVSLDYIKLIIKMYTSMQPGKELILIVLCT